MSGSDKKVVPLPVGTSPGGVGAGTPLKPAPGHQLAAFAQGCFWGTEYRFRQVPGVVATAVGYTGGKTPNPSYEDVGGHGTGHAESVLIEFDPAKVSYARLLEIFWSSHDSTSGEPAGPGRRLAVPLGDLHLRPGAAEAGAQPRATRSRRSRRIASPPRSPPPDRSGRPRTTTSSGTRSTATSRAPLPRHARARSGS